MDKNKNLQSAMFGAGCFWGVEQTFRELPGVVATEVGYCGGTVKNPTYEQVCTSYTGHAETVRVEFDPGKISYENLLATFFANHDPTTVNRQGPDIGPEYRSVIFYENPEQEAAAKSFKEKLDKSGHFRSPIATQIVPAQDFFKAEEYHQHYLEKRGRKVCH
jgi:peptide-methionine (S)-S-oxide reductase